MKTRHRLLLFFLLLAAHVTGCRTAQPTPDEHPIGGIMPAPTRSDSAEVMPRNSTKNATKAGLLERLNPFSKQETQKPSASETHKNSTYSTQTGLLNRIFSTSEGTARRQQRKLARARVPRSIGKGAVYAPQALKVVNAYKPRAAVINADSGATVTAIGKNKAPAATAAGATATATTKEAASWKVWALWIGVVGGALGLWYLAAPLVAALPSRQRLLGWAGYKDKTDKTA